MSALFAYLDGLLDAPSPAKRGAGVCLMKDFRRWQIAAFASRGADGGLPGNFKLASMSRPTLFYAS